MNFSDDFLHPATHMADTIVVAASTFCNRGTGTHFRRREAYSLPDGEYIANVVVHCITGVLLHRISNSLKVI